MPICSSVLAFISRSTDEHERHDDQPDARPMAFRDLRSPERLDSTTALGGIPSSGYLSSRFATAPLLEGSSDPASRASTAGRLTSPTVAVR